MFHFSIFQVISLGAMNADGVSPDKMFAQAMDPVFNGLKGETPGRMKTMTEIKLENLKNLEKNRTQSSVMR